MKELLEQRLKTVIKKLDDTADVKSPEHEALVREMAAVTKLLGEYEKSVRDEKAKAVNLDFEREKFAFEKEQWEKECEMNDAKLEFEQEQWEKECEMNDAKLEFEQDKLDLEERKFTQEKAEKLIETQQENEKKWWERVWTGIKIVLRGVEICVAIVALKYEIFNHISGKADWEAIRSVFRGE